MTHAAPEPGDDREDERTPRRKKVTVDLSPVTHARLQRYQYQCNVARGRWVTLSEIIDNLLDLADMQAAMVADALEGK